MRFSAKSDKDMQVVLVRRGSRLNPIKRHLEVSPTTTTNQREWTQYHTQKDPLNEKLEFIKSNE